jgi:Arc/MetJ-type ribon-helix-helix transcriptional regulator
LEERLKCGQYGSADDVVLAALQALNDLDTHTLDEQTLDAIDRAEEQIDRGEVQDWQAVRERVRGKFFGK